MVNVKRPNEDETEARKVQRVSEQPAAALPDTDADPPVPEAALDFTVDTLGCPKCQHSPNGCAQCRDEGYRERRFARLQANAARAQSMFKSKAKGFSKGRGRGRGRGIGPGQLESGFSSFLSVFRVARLLNRTDSAHILQSTGWQVDTLILAQQRRRR